MVAGHPSGSHGTCDSSQSAAKAPRASRSVDALDASTAEGEGVAVAGAGVVQQQQMFGGETLSAVLTAALTRAYMDPTNTGISKQAANAVRGMLWDFGMHLAASEAPLLQRAWVS